MPRRLQRGFWSVQSRTWDQPYTQPSSQEWVQEVCDWLAGHVAGRIVVDAGCGTGVHAHALGARGFDVVGVDFASGMLARAAAKPGGASGWVQADLHAALPFADGSVDGVLSVFALQFLSPGRFATEIARVLRPGAPALVLWPRAEYARRKPPQGTPLGVRAASYAKHVSTLVGRRSGVARTHTRDDVETAMRDGGLDVVESRVMVRCYALLVRRAS